MTGPKAFPVVTYQKKACSLNLGLLNGGFYKNHAFRKSILLALAKKVEGIIIRKCIHSALQNPIDDNSFIPKIHLKFAFVHNAIRHMSQT